MHMLDELRRRKVPRTAAAYLAGAFVVLQVADLTFEPLGLPASAYRVLIIVSAVGFPLALLLSWFFDVRADTVKTRLGRKAAIAAALVVVLCSTAMGYGVVRHWNRADYDATYTLAVLPFKVIGSGELSYLGQGIVEMLSRNIDGAGRLRAIPPDMVLAYAGDKTSAQSDVAAKLSARYLVSGSVTQIGEQVRISASLQDYRKNTQPVTRSVEGKTDDLFALIDQLSAQLLSATRSGQDAQLSQSAALTTRSLPALRRYLTGEDYYRRTQYDSAIVELTEATRLDTTFALAYYRLAGALINNNAGAPAVRAIASAQQHAAKLNAHDRALIDAFATATDGRFSEAERKYRALLEQYPGDMEATFQLADMIAYVSPYQARSPDEAKTLFAQLEAGDPEFLCPI